MIDFTYRAIPDYTMEALQRYIHDRVPTGGFLQAVLSNDLREACGRADENNQRILPELLAYLYNEAPGNCWGSPERYKAWLRSAESDEEKTA